MDSFIKPFIYKGKTTILTVEKSVKNSGLKCGEKVDKWIKKFIIFLNVRKPKFKNLKENYPPIFSTMWIEYPQRLGKILTLFIKIWL